MMLETILFALSFALAYILTNRILKISLERKLYDIPDHRSSHYVPKPRLGGIGIVITFYLTSIILIFAGKDIFPSLRAAVGVYSAGFLVAATGFVDDIKGLDARLKLLIQFAAATMVILAGVILRQFRLPFIGSINLGVLSVPATYLWILCIMNFYNFVDGIDGLAAGVGVIGSLFLAFMARSSALPGLALLYAILAGGGFGFLRYNFPPAKIFMGDTGSTFLGFIFAALAVISNGRGVPAFVTVLVFGSVFADALLTLSRRILNREKILSPHRTHYYQRLTSIGFSHKQVTLLEYIITASLGVSAFFFLTGDRIFITVFSVFWVLFFLLVLIKIRSMERGKTLFWEGRTLIIATGDFFLIGASYVLSYYLRLNFSFPEAETSSMLISLPIVLIIRTIIFYYSGLYRAVWRYVTFDDLISIVKAVSLSTLVIIVLFTMFFRFESFPRSVFLIDMFILTVFISGSRVITRWFHDLPKHESISARRVAIVGTGVTPEAVLQKIKRSRDLQPVGYLDDRSRMQGRVVGGLRVLGTLEQAPAIVSDYQVEEFILMDSYLDRIPGDLLERIKDAGGKVNVISGPEDIDEDHFTGFEKLPFRDRSVMLISSGRLCRYAGPVLSRASRLVISADSRGGTDLTGRTDKPAFNYYGAASSPGLLGSIMDEHEVDYVIYEFSADFSRFDNPLFAYFNGIYLPLKTAASEVAERDTVRMIVISSTGRGCGSLIDTACAVTEAALLEFFREGRERLCIIRSDNGRTPGWYRRTLLQAEESGGGVYRGDSESDRLVLLESGEKLKLGHSYISVIEEGIKAGDYDKVRSVLREAAGRFEELW
ncbi:MAG: hypothetical protein GF417_05385 [Candidatus Latescibacteria bacterium]|nr:hypothetical protein [bacterium]MBD3423848.1 hypothetical protein [Candidatus Latescibacterota bacterium]